MINNCSKCTAAFADLDQEWHDKIVHLDELAGAEVIALVYELLDDASSVTPAGRIAGDDSNGWHDFLDAHFGPSWWGADDRRVPAAVMLEVLTTVVTAVANAGTREFAEFLGVSVERAIEMNDAHRARPIHRSVVAALPARGDGRVSVSTADIATLTEGMRALVDDMRAQRVEAERQLSVRDEVDLASTEQHMRAEGDAFDEGPDPAH